MSTLASRGRSAVRGLHGATAQGWHSLAAALDRADWIVLPALAFGLSRLLIFVAAYLGDTCLLYTSPSPRDRTRSRMPSSA